MDVKEDGTVQVSGYDQDKLKEAEELKGSWRWWWKWQGRQKGKAKVRRPDPVEGETYTGKITGIQALGVL
jgi:hypothetical protein